MIKAQGKNFQLTVSPISPFPLQKEKNKGIEPFSTPKLLERVILMQNSIKQDIDVVGGSGGVVLFIVILMCINFSHLANLFEEK